MLRRLLEAWQKETEEVAETPSQTVSDQGSNHGPITNPTQDDLHYHEASSPGSDEQHSQPDFLARSLSDSTTQYSSLDAYEAPPTLDIQESFPKIISGAEVKATISQRRADVIDMLNRRSVFEYQLAALREGYNQLADQIKNLDAELARKLETQVQFFSEQNSHTEHINYLYREIDILENMLRILTRKPS